MFRFSTVDDLVLYTNITVKLKSNDPVARHRAFPLLQRPLAADAAALLGARATS
jgi:hypothetical protein